MEVTDFSLLTSVNLNQATQHHIPDYCDHQPLVWEQQISKKTLHHIFADVCYFHLVLQQHEKIT
jgi:hypothetical protein